MQRSVGSPSVEARRSDRRERREAVEIRVEEREAQAAVEVASQAAVDALDAPDGTPADRPLFGIDGPRRRPREMPAMIAPAAPADHAGGELPQATLSKAHDASAMRERWLAEARARARPALAPEHGLDDRFERLRDDLTRELRRSIDDAVARIDATFEREIDALRSMSREEGNRLRSTNGEELVRTRAANTAELDRIRRTIEDGIGRLCDVIEEELDH